MFGYVAQARAKLLTFVLAFGVFSYSLSTIPVYTTLESSTLVASAVVGMFAGVPANEYNTLAADLAAKEAELTARERALGSAPATPPERSMGDWFGVAAFGVSALVLVLLLVNFYGDYRRAYRDRSRGIYEIHLEH
jgi:hypothetical protein